VGWGVIGGLIFALIISWIDEQFSMLRGTPIFGPSYMIYGLVVGLIVGLICGLSVGLISVISGLIIGLRDVLEQCVGIFQVPQRFRLNEGVKHSSQHGLRMGLASGLLYGSLYGHIFGLGISIFSGLQVGMIYGLLAGLLVGLIVGPFVGLFEYGAAVPIQHYTLRWLLARAGALPYPFSDYHLVAFLDAMHERILLRRVGGGWIFVHRSLLEYFASLPGSVRL
jgi:hypothetical protein